MNTPSQTPEADLILSEFFSHSMPSGGACGQTVGAESWRLIFTGNKRGEFEEAVRSLERRRDELADLLRMALYRFEEDETPSREEFIAMRTALARIKKGTEK